MLGFLATIGPLSTDLYLPTFTNMAADIEVPAALVQLTLTGFLIGLGTGPLFVGPLSDRFGRRPVLLAALVVFVISGVAMTLITEVWVLVALRVVQGIAAAAGTVLSRAVVSDLAPRASAVRALSIIVFAVGIGALAAAPLGAAVGTLWGWRGALLTLAGIGALMLVLAAVFLPESLPHEERHGKQNGKGSITALITALRMPQVLAYALVLGTAYAAMMSYISASPFVASDVLGLPAQQYAWMFAASSSAMLASSALNAWLGVRAGPRRMLVIGQIFILGSALVMFTLSSAGALTPSVFFGLGFGIVFGFGLTLANTTALALATAGAVRGSASALLSTTQYSLGAVATPFVGLWGSSTSLPMAVTIMIFATIAITTTTLTLRTYRS